MPSGLFSQTAFILVHSSQQGVHAGIGRPATAGNIAGLLGGLAVGLAAFTHCSCLFWRLDDRRKAGRSLSPDDITHWLRVYAALEATQTLMQQIDAAIDAHGGWPGAFSQNHPPPDAATLAAEQMAHKEQAKAHKKAALAAKKSAASASPTGGNSLFDFDDDLDGLAAAAGVSPPPTL